MPTDVIIAIPEVSTSVSIKADWIVMRDKLLEDAAAFPAVKDQDEYELASDTLKNITKASNELEIMRKDLARPFQEAAKVIKGAADKALGPLEEAKENLKAALAHYATEQRRKAEEERRRIEQAEREAAEKAAAEQQELEEAGLVDEDEPLVLSPALIVQPQVREPKAPTTRLSERVTWEVTDLENIPEQFKSFDPKKLNGWLKMNQDVVKERLSKDSDGTGIVAGVIFKIETTVMSR